MPTAAALCRHPAVATGAVATLAAAAVATLAAAAVATLAVSAAAALLGRSRSGRGRDRHGDWRHDVGVTSACWPGGPEGEPGGASGIASMTAETGRRRPNST